MIRRLITAQSAGVAVFVALCLPVVIGLAALGTEVSFWLLTQRSMQGAADAAAISASFANTSLTTMKNQAFAVAAQNGYTNGSNGVTVVVNSPPSQGNFTGNATAIEVIVKQTQARLFSVLFLNADPTVAARAVVASVDAGGCVLGLAGTNNTNDIDVSGSGTVQLDGCQVDANSNFHIQGAATLDTTEIVVDGKIKTTGNAYTIPASTKQSPNYPNAFPDPYLNRQNSFPAMPSPCNNFPTSGTASQGCYKGINLSGGSVTMNPGIYYVDGVYGGLSLSGGASLTGTGVTIFLTSSTPANASTIATMSMTGGSSITISAPTTGVAAGLAIMQDNRATQNSSGGSFGGTGTLDITGAIYFPQSDLTFIGNQTMTSNCTNVIAWEIQFQGNTTLQNICSQAGTTPFGAPDFRLME